MDVEEEIAWKIRNDCGKYIREGRSIAAALMPLVRKAQAEALREAAVKAQEAFVAEQSGIGYARVRADWPHAEARRIEQNSEGNET